VSTFYLVIPVMYHWSSVSSLLPVTTVNITVVLHRYQNVSTVKFEVTSFFALDIWPIGGKVELYMTYILFHKFRAKSHCYKISKFTIPHIGSFRDFFVLFILLYSFHSSIIRKQN